MPITVLNHISETRDHLANLRAERNGSVVLVPTMGALHEGHSSLIREARDLAGAEGVVVVSVFVNPTQFGPNEDLEAYPRSLEHDESVSETSGADVLFAPSVAEMYQPDHSIDIRETRLYVGLCGASRPGHFPGVCLVVMKLFGLENDVGDLVDDYHGR